MSAALDRRIPMIGTVVFVASASMMFASLLFAYSLLREQGELGDWIALPAALPMLASGLVLGCSLALRHKAVLALFLALGFLITQLLWWRELMAMGILITDSPRASFVYALTAFHAAHVVVGVGGVAQLVLKRNAAGRGWVLYWDFVAAVWFVIAAALFFVR